MKKDKFTTLLLILIFLAGMSLLLYPTVSDYWNSFHTSRAVAEYNEEVSNLSPIDYEKLLNEAKDYNAELAMGLQSHTLSDRKKEIYDSILNINGDGIMGYVEIPIIDVSIPIYHGTDEKILRIATGHLEWTSFPVGGESTHAVLSGHRGLPSAKIFTNLDKLSEGDTFEVRVLNEVLTYEIDQILIVRPENIEPLEIVDGKDYCTLVTCTPYGINSHRLLVRGKRIDTVEGSEKIRITSDAIQIDPIIVAQVLAVPILIILLVWITLRDKRENEKRRRLNRMINRRDK